jgi:hypothetical protein
VDVHTNSPMRLKLFGTVDAATRYATFAREKLCIGAESRRLLNPLRRPHKPRLAELVSIARLTCANR